MAKAKGGLARPVLVIIGAVALVLAAATVVAAFWVSRSSVAAQLERTLSRNLGRQVSIGGGVHLTVWPVWGSRREG